MAAARLPVAPLPYTPVLLARCRSFPAACSSCSLRPSFPVLSVSSSVLGTGQSLPRAQFYVQAVVDADTDIQATPQVVDDLVMNFRAEGTIADSSISKVLEVLKKVQGVSNVKVFSAEGIATAELSKQTNIQATGEASSLVELLKGEGFKVQNLSISFDDGGADDDDIVYEYENSS